MSDFDDLKDWLHVMHGHRMCLVAQHVRDTEMRKAALKQGEATGLVKAISAIENIEEDGVPDFDDGELHYHALSKQRFQVQQAMAKPTDNDSLRGLE